MSEPRDTHEYERGPEGSIMWAIPPRSRRRRVNARRWWAVAVAGGVTVFVTALWLGVLR